MRFTRRQLTVAGVLTFGASSLLSRSPSVAQSPQMDDVDRAVEALRKAMVDVDQARLEELTADELSYGHSGGTIQTKAQFVDVIVRKETIYKSITLSEPWAAIAGDNAIVRHVFSTDYESGGKPGTSRIGALQVWQRKGDAWKLLARQGFKT